MKPVIEGTFLLEKIPGKGGWTYVRLPGLGSAYRGKWGTVRVSGTIDNYELVDYGLMPIRDGGLFLPIKAEIRKKTGKQEGDLVHITLYAEQQQEAETKPEDLLLCLQDEPEAYRIYQSYSVAEQRAFLDWIAAATRDDVWVKRIALSIEMLLRKQKK